MGNSEIEDLKKRVDQLEKALLALAQNKPICVDKDGHPMAVEGALANLMPVYGSKPVEE